MFHETFPYTPRCIPDIKAFARFRLVVHPHTLDTVDNITNHREIALEKETNRKARDMLSDSDAKLLEDVKHKELQCMRESLKKHFEKRLMWLEVK